MTNASATSELSDAQRRMIEAAVAAQGFTRLLGAEILALRRGGCRLGLRRRADLLQQHGFFHGGVIAYLVDNASAIAAGTMLRPGQDLLSLEFKLNYLRPARGLLLAAEARVVKPGTRFTVVSCAVAAADRPDDLPADLAAAGDSLVATGLATIAVTEAASGPARG